VTRNQVGDQRAWPSEEQNTAYFVGGCNCSKNTDWWILKRQSQVQGWRSRWMSPMILRDQCCFCIDWLPFAEMKVVGVGCFAVEMKVRSYQRLNLGRLLLLVGTAAAGIVDHHHFPRNCRTTERTRCPLVVQTRWTRRNPPHPIGATHYQERHSSLPDEHCNACHEHSAVAVVLRVSVLVDCTILSEALHSLSACCR